MGNDFSFDAVKANGFTNELTYRGPKKRSGVSFDYMDKLNQLVDQGIFVDKDGDGFTAAERKALENEFFNIHQEKGYNTNFSKMRAGTKNDYSYEDFVRLAQAAGYVLKEGASVKEEPATVVKKDAVEPDVVSQKATEETPAATVLEVATNPIAATPATVVEDEEGFEPVSQSGKQTLNDIVAAGLPDGEYDIHFTGEKAIDPTNGNVVGEVATGTINGSPFKYTNPGQQVGAPVQVPGTKAEVPAAPATIAATSAEPVATPTVQLSSSGDDIKAYLDADPELAGLTGEQRAEVLRKRGIAIDAQINKLSSPQTHTERGGFLGLGKKKVIVDKTKEQAEQENAAQIADLRVQRDNIDRARVYTSEVEGQFWSGRVAPDSQYDAPDHIVKRSESYDRVTTLDGRRVARTSTYVRDEQGYPSTEYHYYPVAVEKVGNPRYERGTFYQVIPDLEHELTDVKMPENK
ncbi:MAG: hypothetical protein NC200_04085 [Candidatus Gastranaerophilales bacterium]|nr:hypothetical protein [Candidatus Gastranaerophilales bacterium]